MTTAMQTAANDTVEATVSAINEIMQEVSNDTSIKDSGFLNSTLKVDLSNDFLNTDSEKNFMDYMLNNAENNEIQSDDELNDLATGVSEDMTEENIDSSKLTTDNNNEIQSNDELNDVAIGASEDMTEENIDSSKLTTENDLENIIFTPHPLLANYPTIKEDEKTSIDQFMDKNKKMLDPALVTGTYLLSNVYQYQRAIDKGYEIKTQTWEGDENDIPILLEEIEFFKTYKNSTQRAIWTFLNYDNFKKSSYIKKTKEALKGKSETIDTRKEAAKYYNSSDGYFSTAKTYKEKYPVLFEKLFNGIFNFSDAAKIIKFKDSCSFFYDDLLNSIVSIKEIKDYQDAALHGIDLYKLQKSKRIDSVQAKKLIEISSLSRSKYDEFLNEKISFKEIGETLEQLKRDNILNNDSNTTTNNESLVELSADGDNIEKTSNHKNIDNTLILSDSIKYQIIKLAAEKNSSIDDFLSELLEIYNSTNNKIQKEV